MAALLGGDLRGPIELSRSRILFHDEILVLKGTKMGTPVPLGATLGDPTLYTVCSAAGQCGLLPGLRDGSDGTAVRGPRGTRGPLLRLPLRPASLQRQVVQERQGVLQVKEDARF